MLADPPDPSADEASYQKSHQHKSRRGRPRHSNDRNQGSNTYSSQQHGHFDQSFKPPFSHDYSNYAVDQHPPYHDENGPRRRGRGRGRREGNRSVNGNFGSSSSSWQRPGGDFGPHSGNNRGTWPSHSGAHPVDGPDGPNWRRGVDRTLEQTNEDQDAQAKKPRKFSQEQRRGYSEKGTRFKENNTTEGGQRSKNTKGETHPSDIREKTQRPRIGSDLPHDEHQRKHTEAKRRQGPIKPPKPTSQDEMRVVSEHDESGRDRSFQEPAFRAGRGSGRNAPFQARGGRRTHHQNQRPGQRTWAKMPESKETQTG